MKKKIFISQHANKNLIDFFQALSYSVELLNAHGKTYPAVDAHPDIYMCKMGVDRHNHVFHGDFTEIGYSYPQNIRFNAVCLDDYFIHNLKNTSPSLLSEAQQLGLTLIHVKQGYTKCSCVVIDGRSLITADDGIFNRLQQFPDMDILKIHPGFVRLPGFEYGFLGGASGRVGNEIIFNGNLSEHPDYEAIKQFIEIRGLTVKYFSEYPLTDIGSIIEG